MEIENKTTHTKTIMNRIISKGGLYAEVAKLYIDNPDKSALFVLECSKQCHATIAQLYWGDDLTQEIKTYEKTYGY